MEWETVVEIFKPLSDLAYLSLHDQQGNVSLAELIKTLAALVTDLPPSIGPV